MSYELTVAKSQRKCHFCSNKIEKKGMHFRMHYWQEHAEYPTVKNICKACAVRFCDDEWISFLKGLIKKAEELKASIKPLDQESVDDIERCKHCGNDDIKRSGNMVACPRCGAIEVSKLEEKP